ncbi:hypothetical protein [Lacisediminihabitans sp. H27-G8]|uniref:hypothetical protein n=1 Tax=Lacisediminihabitans sp. H27-G8 TaxID=3111909 RepID=UPI0038FC0A82
MALEPVLSVLGIVRVAAEVEISLLNGPRFASGAFVPNDKEDAILAKLLDELAELAITLKGERSRGTR